MSDTLTENVRRDGERTERMLELIKRWYSPGPVECGDYVMEVHAVDETPHRFWAEVPSEEIRRSDEHIREWIEAGRPHDWACVEVVEVPKGIVWGVALATQSVRFEAWEDFGHGLYALFRDGELMGVGRETIVSDDCVLIDVDYYGAKHYLWPRLS